MQAIENWSQVVGRVESWTPPADAESHGELIVTVERVQAVKAGKAGDKAPPNLLEKAEGTTLRVHVPYSAASKLDAPEGATVTVDVRRGRQPGVVFAHPGKIHVRP